MCENVDGTLLEASSTGRPLRVVHPRTISVWMGGMPGSGCNVLASPVDSERFAKEPVDGLLTKSLSRRTSKAPVTVRADVEEGDPERLLVDVSEKACRVMVRLGADL